jgi:ketosteroid isomerase-like protein
MPEAPIGDAGGSALRRGETLWKYEHRLKLPDASTLTYRVPVANPLAVIERLTAAQNAHDLEGMLACFHDDYVSEQPIHPARNFRGLDQVRANWSALLAGIPNLRAEIVRSAVDGDTVFIEIHWIGTKAGGLPFDECGVLVMGVRDDRIAWARLYADEVDREGADIHATVRHMVGDEGQ